MQFEDFDKKLKNAAENHHPDYDEKAWAKMENLLDKHLPQKEDRRRRFIFFLLFPILLGGGLWLMLDRPWQQDRSASNTETISSSKKTSGSTPATGSNSSSLEEEAAKNKEKHDNSSNSIGDEDREVTTTSLNDASQVSGEAGQGDNVEISVNPARKNKQSTKQSSLRANKPGADENFEVETSQAGVGKTKNTVGSKRNDEKLNDPTALRANDPAIGAVTPLTKNEGDGMVSKDAKNDKQVTSSLTKDQPATSPNNEVKQDNTISDAPEASAAQAKEGTAKKPTQKAPVKKSSYLFFSASAGPDLSWVKNNTGEIELLTGFGMGYTFKDRWTIRTGFYSSNKVYSATPNEYKPATPPMNIDYLTNIDANCKVYEIPVTVSYNFARTEKQNFFGSAGLSSFIMKKEQYVYEYYYPGVNQTFHYTHTENNQNKHYFSVLSLSAGYQRKISKVFSVVVEPYLKLPLGGVGYGKVKLNSTGILFSVNVSPFQIGKK
jgi:hypothetical protein